MASATVDAEPRKPRRVLPPLLSIRGSRCEGSAMSSTAVICSVDRLRFHIRQHFLSNDDPRAKETGHAAGSKLLHFTDLKDWLDGQGGELIRQRYPFLDQIAKAIDRVQLDLEQCSGSEWELAQARFRLLLAAPFCWWHRD